MVTPQLYDQDTDEQNRRRRTRDGAPQLSRYNAKMRHPSRRQLLPKPSPIQRTRGVLGMAWRGSAGWILPLVVLVASLVGLYVIAGDRLRGSDDGAPLPTGADAVASVATAGPSALLVQLDEGGAAVAFTLLALDGDAGGTVVFVPASTMVEIPGFGLDELRRAVELGGVQLASLSLANLLSLDFAHVTVLNAADWRATTRALGTLSVANPARLDRVADDGRVEVLWPQGPIDLTSDEIAGFLAVRAIEETDLERMVRHQAFWTAYLTARSGILGTADDPTADVDAFLDEAAVRAEALDYRILPVETVGGPDELYGVDTAGLTDLLAVIAPTDGTDPSSRVRVQVLNGVGTPGLAEPVTARLLPTGAVVQLTGNALEFDHDVTQIVYYRDEHIESALRIRDELGVGEVVKQRDPIDVVDITVVVGRDLAELVTE